MLPTRPSQSVQSGSLLRFAIDRVDLLNETLPPPPFSACFAVPPARGVISSKPAKPVITILLRNPGPICV